MWLIVARFHLAASRKSMAAISTSRCESIHMIMYKNQKLNEMASLNINLKSSQFEDQNFSWGRPRERWLRGGPQISVRVCERQKDVLIGLNETESLTMDRSLWGGYPNVELNFEPDSVNFEPTKPNSVAVLYGRHDFWIFKLSQL